jgi:ABC-2 type transport system permease protein
MSVPAVAVPVFPERATRRLTFRGMLASEWVKARAVRSTWWNIGVLVVLSGAFAALMGTMLRGDAEARADLTATFDSPGLGVGAAFVSGSYLVAAIIVPLLAALLMAAEYSSGSIRATLVAAPRRVPALAAKAIVAVALAIVMAVVAGVAGLATGLALTAGQGIAAPSFGESARLLAGTAGAMGLYALMALGFAALLRSSAGAIATSLGIVLGLPMILNLIPFDWAHEAMNYIPLALGQTVAGFSGVLVAEVVGGLWGSAGFLALWAAVPFAAGAALFHRRDA